MEVKEEAERVPDVPGTKRFEEEAEPKAAQEELDDLPVAAASSPVVPGAPVVPGTPGFEAAPYVAPAVPGTPTFDAPVPDAYAPGPDVPAVPQIPVSVSAPEVAETARREEEEEAITESKREEVARRHSEKEAAAKVAASPVPVGTVPEYMDTGTQKMAQAAQEAAKVSCLPVFPLDL